MIPNFVVVSLVSLVFPAGGTPAKAEGHEWHKRHKGRCIVGTNLKVGKTAPTLANLTTPLAPQNPFVPWGFSPQAERLLSNN